MGIFLGVVSILIGVLALPWLRRPIDRLASQVFSTKRARRFRVNCLSTNAKSDLEKDLVTYMWQFPKAKYGNPLWAVKENKVLNGDLVAATKNPGLGVSFVSVELAMAISGQAAMPLIKKCLNEVYSMTSPTPPYFLLTEDLRTSTRSVVDYRHTVAFAIALAQSGIYPELMSGYLDAVLSRQLQDGGWSPGDGISSSELFSTSYSVDFAHIARETVDDERRSMRIDECIRRGLNRVRAMRGQDGLWSTEGTSPTWERLAVSSWIAYRLSRISSDSGWNGEIGESLQAMVRQSSATETWQGTPDLLEFRVKARIAGAISVVLDGNPELARRDSLISDYLESTARFCTEVMCGLPQSEWDLSTVNFMIETLVGRSNLPKFSEMVLGA